MTADDAIRELVDVSEDVAAAVMFGRTGDVAAATIAEDQARFVADVAGAMLSYADALRATASVEQVEAVTTGGAVYVVRDADRAVVAVTGPEPVSGLVLHDVRECLRKSAPRTRKRARATA